ncbi:hypothetical protein [Paenibacillus xylanilyticus]|uniref:Uncharacterized protein n=1 Tax=Paenibacillus xylanilyticus TaxID=248903 RepID=A0A7Y6C389_9BACL|nr:hypothetical protein [Paenibacillus xylanilyticus]NUU79812.1 hypothetical protein [Paenibacillus xylanilyticus]
MKYPSVLFQSGVMSSVTGGDGDFRLQLERSEATARSRKLLFATGMKDVLPDIEGFPKCMAPQLLSVRSMMDGR